MTNKKIRVFLSRPNPFTNEQQYFIDKLKSTLENYNIESITLQAKDYSPYESLTVLNEMIKSITMRTKLIQCIELKAICILKSI